MFDISVSMVASKGSINSIASHRTKEKTKQETIYSDRHRASYSCGMDMH